MCVNVSAASDFSLVLRGESGICAFLSLTLSLRLVESGRTSMALTHGAVSVQPGNRRHWRQPPIAIASRSARDVGVRV